ncbi:MAG: VCBS repeat-containing protein [Acidobacteriota bacterium]|nr:VCBS repeat-containing protein [Acidobacteriota bacterium]
MFRFAVALSRGRSRTALLAASALFSAPAGLPPLAAARSAPYLPPRVVALGSDHNPDALAGGDFDGDGRLDLAVGSAGSNDVIVFLGDGRGGLRRAGAFPAGPDPAEIAAADLNRDGRLDLAIANHGVPLVTVLLGDGRGGFRAAPGSPFRVRSQPHPHTIGVCDADRDGAPDLVIDSWGENRFTFLRGDGKGGFAAPGVPIEAGRKPYRNLRLADLDADGRCDLVAPNLAGGHVTVLKGDGAGHFGGAANPPLAGGPSPFAVDVADVNRDGRPDILVANYSGQGTDPSGDGLTSLVNEGGGRFRLGPRIATGRASGDVAGGDIDGDGYADAATANQVDDTLTIAFGGPDGLSPSRTATVRVGGHPERVLLADFNGDRKADAVTANPEDHSISILMTRQ